MNATSQKLNDSALFRWMTLLLFSSAMFFAYMFTDILSPLQSLLQEQPLGWAPAVYGTYASSAYYLNVFALFLIFAGIILDKMGVRFTAVLANSVMIFGASIKFYAVSSYFTPDSAIYEFLSSFLPSIPATAKLAAVGFMFFGSGLEMAGITASKAIVKWFAGKEMALAMGLQMAISRLGVFAVFRLSPMLASDGDVSKPVAIVCLLLCVGLINILIYNVFDRKLDAQTEAERSAKHEEQEEPFHLKDVAALFTSKTFLIVAFLCVLYYSAIFPFQKFATSMLESRLNISASEAAEIFSWFPIGAMLLTPILGNFLDRRGKAASMLMLGSILMTVCHLTFALYPMDSSSSGVAFAAIIVLGISFSLVPAALWPSVPKLVDTRYLGSAYSVIFWIQNIGLMIFPILIGQVLAAANPEVSKAVLAGETPSMPYNYTLPMLLFASLGVIAFLLAAWLKVEDKKKGYGLEEPNIK